MSIVNIAEKAEVSVATVSRYLNNGKVSEKTCKKIESVIKQSGYGFEANRPGRKNCRRVGIKTGVVLFLTIGSLDSQQLMAQYPYNPLMCKIMRQINLNGLNVMLMHIDDGKTIPRRLSSKYFDGVLAFCRDVDISPGLKKQLKTLPVVWVLNSSVDVNNMDMDQTIYNNTMVGSLAASHLAERGHKHLGFFTHMFNDIAKQRWESFKVSAENAGCQPELIFSEFRTYDKSTKDALEHIRQSKQLTGLFFLSDSYMSAVQNAMIHAKFDINKYDFIGCDYSRQILQLFAVRPPSIDIHLDKIGEESVKVLLSRINSNNQKEVEIKIYDPVVRYD